MKGPKASAALLIILTFLTLLFLSHFLVAGWPLD